MPATREKGYTTASRRHRHDPERNQTILLVGRIGLCTGLYALIDERLEEKGWNWTTLAGHVGYTRAHVANACQADKLSLGLFMQVMRVLGLRWQDHCKLEYPKMPA